MEIPDHLRCLFTASIDPDRDTYTIEVPERELDAGELAVGETYRVALLPLPDSRSDPDESGDSASRSPSPQGPPVSEGERRIVEVEDVGEQGDGVARVERGYVVIVPDTELGERVRVEMDHVKPNVAFAEVIERLDGSP